MIQSIKERYWVWLVLIAWGAALLTGGLLRMTPYQIDEASAHALLLVWSVSDKIISTVFVFGIPDFRALLFIPLGIYWPGSLLAAKVFTLLLTFLACWLTYRWSRDRDGGEAALLATGLMLIAPITIGQIDTIGAGPYILMCFGLGWWLDRAHRGSERPLGGWYFTQLLLVLIAVTLHPAALAYPLALLWRWYRQPLNAKQQRHVYIGVVIAVFLALTLRMGWKGVVWLHNPLEALARGAIGYDVALGSVHWVIAVVLAAWLALGLILQRRAVVDDFFTTMLVLGLALGLAVADAAWAFLALATTLYLGIPVLIRLNRGLGATGFMGQRGLVMLAIFLCAMVFMQADKAHQQAVAQNLFSPLGELLLTLENELQEGDAETTKIMSQWPAQTMLVARRPTFPLPPAYPDGETLMRNITGVTHLVFDPFDPENRALSSQLAGLAGATETLALQPGGAIIRIRNGESGATHPE